MAVSLRGSEERMKRTVLLTAALVFLLTVPISAASLFSDVRQTDWFASYVETAHDLGIVSGYPDGSFKPSRRVSYGEFLAMAMRGQGTSNTDVTPYKAHWARPFYDAAAAQEIFSEAQVPSRVLDEPIPRRDMVLIMAGLLGKAGLSGRNVKQADLLFSDVEATDEREYPIALCAYYGALTGYPDGTFRPLGFLTRAEAAAAMTALAQITGAEAPADPEPAEEPESPVSAKPAEPKTREELLQRKEERVLVKTGNAEVLSFMDDAARSYLQSVVTSARFVKEDGKYVVKLAWPALPEGCGGKIDVQVCDRNGTGLDGYVWICRKGMEKMPTYRADLKEAGGAQFVFDLADLKNAGTAALLVTVTREDGPAESSLALAEQDLTSGKTQVQYKVASDRYQLSGTLPLDAPVFQWK